MSLGMISGMEFRLVSWFVFGRCWPASAIKSPRTPLACTVRRADQSPIDPDSRTNQCWQNLSNTVQRFSKRTKSRASNSKVSAAVAAKAQRSAILPRYFTSTMPTQIYKKSRATVSSAWPTPNDPTRSLLGNNPERCHRECRSKRPLTIERLIVSLFA